MSVRRATLDPALRATIVERTPLRYAAGADSTLDRPAHVRAGSSLAWVNDHLVLIQDDTNFLALIHPGSGRVDSITLPVGEAGLRQFGDDRGNKKYKLDLEACCSLPGPDGPLLLAFGSGSKRRRRNILLADQWTSAAPRLALTDASPLYEALESSTDFAGSDMNIEGALHLDGVLRLFGRGNGKMRDGLVPVDATCDLPLDEVLTWLDDPSGEPPKPRDITRYILGAIDDVPLGFTDATVFGDQVLYTAAAEDTDDASEDGRVAGSAIGVLAPGGATRYAVLRDDSGRSSTDKVEGLALNLAEPTQAWLVIDADDTTRPSELCRVLLSGPWI